MVHSRSGDASTVAQRLQGSQFDIAVVPVGRTMIDSLIQRRPAIVIVEHDTGAFDLPRVCRDLSASVQSWIIVMTGSDYESDDVVIRVLEAGADDVLPRNTSAARLLAHVRVGLRSRPIVQPTATQIAVGDVVVDLNAHATFVAGAPVKCPPRQFLLLAALARHPNVVIDHDTLMTSVWGEQPDVIDPRRLRIAVSLLRGVLGSGPNRPRIETVPHVGYRLVVATNEQPAA